MDLIKLKTEEKENKILRMEEDFLDDQEFEPENGEKPKNFRSRKIAWFISLLMVFIFIGLNSFYFIIPFRQEKDKGREEKIVNLSTLPPNKDRVLETSEKDKDEPLAPEEENFPPPEKESAKKSDLANAKPAQTEGQSKKWSDGEKLWKAVHEDDNIKLWYSKDNGESWRENGQAAINVSTDDFTVIADNCRAVIAYAEKFDIKTLESGPAYPAEDFTWQEEALVVYDGRSENYAYQNPRLSLTEEGRLWTSAEFQTLGLQESAYIVDDTDAQAYEGDTADGAFNASENEFTAGEYANIDEDDNNYVEDTGATQATYQYHRFDFSISEAIDDITQIDIIWKGMGSCFMNNMMCGNGHSLWVKESGTWTEKDSGTSSFKETLSAQYTSGFSNLISSGHIHVAAQSDIPGTRFLDASLLDSWYAEVKVTYDSGIEIPENILILFVLIPFLPIFIRQILKKKSPPFSRANLITFIFLFLFLVYFQAGEMPLELKMAQKEKIYRLSPESYIYKNDRREYKVERDITDLLKNNNTCPKKDNAFPSARDKNQPMAKSPALNISEEDKIKRKKYR